MEHARQFTRDNHYVPQSYLRRWTNEDGLVWASRILVSNAGVPLWKPISPKAIAKHQHLYTRITGGADCDEIEHWLNRDFENPALAAIEKAVTDERLSAQEWQAIIRFLAAQDVRTPARFYESMMRWQKELPAMLDEILHSSVADLEEAIRTGVRPESVAHTYGDHVPFKVHKEFEPGEEHGKLHIRTIAGRGLWLFSMRQLLTRTVNALLQHKWTILKCPAGMSWLTSDDPVVKLNFESAAKYDFGGGWGSRGTEIFMPLSPEHLLYTRIGFRPAPRGTVLSPDEAHNFQRFIVLHAHRFIFASRPYHALSKIRQRYVSAEVYQSEAEQWNTWHNTQKTAETDLTSNPAES